MKYKQTMQLLKERNEELLAGFLEVDDEKNVKIHFVIKSILATDKPFSRLTADVAMNILKDLDYSIDEAFEIYKFLAFK